MVFGESPPILFPGRSFMELAYGSSEFEEIHSLFIISICPELHHRMHLTAGRSVSFALVSRFAWPVMLHRLYSTHPFPSCSVVQNCGPLPKGAGTHPLEDPSYDIYEVSHQKPSMPERISLNHFFYLSKIACSVLNMHVYWLGNKPV